MYVRNMLIGLLLSLVLMASCATNASAGKLTMWQDNAPAITELAAYMTDITNPDSEKFIPVSDRIAVFDLDGTLYCEKQPIYAIWLTFAKRVLDDSGYHASDSMKSLAETIAALNQDSSFPDNLEKDEAKAEAEAFAGMSLGEYETYVKDFMRGSAVGFSGMTRAEAFYRPMLELIEYLKANGFTVYICSGTDRFWVRAAVDGVIDIPKERIIGMDTTLVATEQGNSIDGLDYVYRITDEVLRGNRLIVKNVKMNKVSQIAQEIGRQPVLAFGNSSGDFSMCSYVVNGNPYESMAFMVIADDTQREYGNPAKAAKMMETCKKNGWIPISMKNDWKTIYADGVLKTGNL